MERNQYIQPLHYGNVCIGFDSRSLVLFSFRGRFKRQMYVIQMDHKCIDLVFDSSECVLQDNSCLNHLSFAVCLTVLQWVFFGFFFLECWSLRMYKGIAYVQLKGVTVHSRHPDQRFCTHIKREKKTDKLLAPALSCPTAGCCDRAAAARKRE